MYALAERLHLDEDVILGWTWDKLQRWQINDEVHIMAQRVKTAFKNLTDAEAWEMVRDEQEENDYPGITSLKDER